MATCAAENCNATVDPERLMCLRHWRMVTDATQREVYATWRRVRREPQAYRDAREKAIDEVAQAEANRTNINQGKLDL